MSVVKTYFERTEFMTRVKGKLRRLFAVALSTVMIANTIPQAQNYVYAVEEQEVEGSMPQLLAEDGESYQEEEPEQEEAQQEEPDQEEPKQEESQPQEESKPEESQPQEESQPEESQPQEEPKPEESQSQEESKPEESQPQETLNEESKTEEATTEEPKTEESSTEESKTEETSTEEPKTEESSTEESKTEESSIEESETKESKTLEYEIKEEIVEETEEETEEDETEEEEELEETEEETETEEPEPVECEITYKAVAQKYNPNNISVILMAEVTNYTGDTDDIKLCWKYLSGDVFPNTDAIKVLSSDIINLKVIDKEADLKNFTLRCEITGLLPETKYSFKIGTIVDGIEEYSEKPITVTTAAAPFSKDAIAFNAKQSNASDIQIDYNISVPGSSGAISAAVYYKLSGDKGYTYHTTHEISAGGTIKGSIYELAAGKTYNLMIMAGGIKKEVSVNMSNVSVAVILPSEFDEESASYNIVIDEFWYKTGNSKKFTKYSLKNLLSYQNTILLQVPNGSELSFKVSFKDDYSMNYVSVAGMDSYLEEDEQGVYTYKVSRERIYVEMVPRQKYNVSFYGENINVLDVDEHNVNITKAVTTKGESTFSFKVIPDKGYTIKSVTSDSKDFVITKSIENDGWYCTMNAKSLLANNVTVYVVTSKTRKYELSFDYPKEAMELTVTVGDKIAALKNNKLRVDDNEVVRFSLINKNSQKGIFVSYTDSGNQIPLFYNGYNQSENTNSVIYDYYLGCLQNGSMTVNVMLTDMCEISFLTKSDNDYSVQLYKPYTDTLKKGSMIQLPRGYELEFGIKDTHQYGSVYASTTDDEAGRLNGYYSQELEQYIYTYMPEQSKELNLVYNPAKLRFSYNDEEVEDLIILNGNTQLELDNNKDLDYTKSYNITLKVKPKQNRTVRTGYYIYQEEDYKSLAAIECSKKDSEGYYYYNIGTTDAHCITIECPKTTTITFDEGLDNAGIEILEYYDDEDEYYEFKALKDSTYTCYKGNKILFRVKNTLDKSTELMAASNGSIITLESSYDEAYEENVYSVMVTEDTIITSDITAIPAVG